MLLRLEVLIEKLSDIQTSRSFEYRFKIILQLTLLNAVNDFDSSQLLYYKPANTEQDVTSDLYSSLATAKRTTAYSSLKLDRLAHFADRRFVRRNSSRKVRTSRLKKC